LSHSNLTFKACWEASKSRLHGSTFTQLSNHHCISTPGMYYSKTCIEQTFSQKYLPFTLSLPCAQLQSSWHLCLKVWNIGKHAMQIKHSYLPSSILLELQQNHDCSLQLPDLNCQHTSENLNKAFMFHTVLAVWFWVTDILIIQKKSTWKSSKK
jgi:hypothetical protein